MADLCFRALVTPRDKIRAGGREMFSKELWRWQPGSESQSAVASRSGDRTQCRASRRSPRTHPESQGPWRDWQRGQGGSTCFGDIRWHAPAGREGQILPGPQAWVGNQIASVPGLCPCKVLKLFKFPEGRNLSLSVSSVLIVG